jgi:hypothetical protein
MRERAGSHEERESALERALLRAGASYQTSASARAKTLAALGVAGSATLLAGAAQSAMLPSVAKLTWGMVLVAVSVVGAATAVPLGYHTWQHHQTATHGVSAVGLVAVARAIDPPAHELPAPPIAATIAPTVVATGGTESTVARPGRAAARPNVTLAHELSLVDAAQASLAEGDAAGALARLEAYERAYPRGRLQLEADVLRLDALEASGRSDAARDRADVFLSRNPHSVLTTHVRTRLGD